MPARIEWEGYRDAYRLHIWHRVQGDDIEVAMADGTWQLVNAMAVIPADAGLVIRGREFDEVFEAFLKYKGFKSHDPTEVKVLREWLGREMTQVDKLIDKAFD